jgi:hypothetical protein
MKKDLQGGGTNTDGSISNEYCSYCYQNGDFLFHGTVQEFQEHCREIMGKSGYNKFIAWLFTRGLKRLKRWKN